MTTKNWWREEMPIETAKLVLGEEHFNFCISRGKAYCHGRAVGSWDACLQESYGAYKTAEKLAS